MKSPLYHVQDLVLNTLNKIKKFPFVLSGGTALSRFYFHHRFSEDLDFFFEGYDYSFSKVSQVISFLRKSGFVCEVIGRSDQAGQMKVDSYAITSSQSKTCRSETCRLETPLKIDFLEDPFSGMWPVQKKKTESGVSFKVDHLDQIYYRKIYSILVQWYSEKKIQRVKDLVDLYELHTRHRPMDEMIEMLIKEHVPIHEEKLILALTDLKKEDIKTDLRLLHSSVGAADLCRVFKQSMEKLIKKGLAV